MANVPSTFYPKISPDIPWETRKHLQLIYQKINNHALAFSQVQGLKGNVTNNIIENFGGGSGGGGGVVIGGVNNQTGVTSYTTQSTDNGVLLVVGDASPVAITLNSGVSSPFFLYITNFGTSVATLTASSGTLTGGTTLQPEDFTIAFYDGTNWWSTLTTIIVLETNGTLNSNQSLLNLVAGSNVTLSESGGSVTIAASGGGGGASKLPHDETASRTLGSTYQNTTGTDMVISGYCDTSGGGTGAIQALIGTAVPTDVIWSSAYTATLSSGRAGFNFYVPDTYFYQLNVVGGLGTAITGVGNWIEFY